jgi:hypothetical protein
MAICSAAKLPAKETTPSDSGAPGSGEPRSNDLSSEDAEILEALFGRNVEG